MRRKVRIALLLFILSITPFFKGCDATFGFPFPAINDIVSAYGGIGDTIEGLCWKLESHATVMLVMVNILIACLFSSVLIRKEKNITWTTPFLNALTVNLSIMWLMLFLHLIAPISAFRGANTPPDNIFLTTITDAVWNYVYGWYIAAVPFNLYGFIQDKIAMTDTGQGVLIDALTRAWFVIITALLTWIWYMAGMIFPKALNNKTETKETFQP